MTALDSCHTCLYLLVILLDTIAFFALVFLFILMHEVLLGERIKRNAGASREQALLILKRQKILIMALLLLIHYFEL